MRLRRPPLTARVARRLCLRHAGGTPETRRPAGAWGAWTPPPSLGGTSAMVVSGSPIASEVGRDILKQGGNAVDAAVAVGFALAVVHPEAGNLGGGGFMVIRLHDGTALSLDYRETAPAAASRDMYLGPDGQPTEKSVTGHLSAGVPGSVAGLVEAHRKLGHLPLAALVEPALRLARRRLRGRRVSQQLHRGRQREAGPLPRPPVPRSSPVALPRNRGRCCASPTSLNPRGDSGQRRRGVLPRPRRRPDRRRNGPAAAG